MIDISVSSLVKSFELGKNILDGLTFTVNSGERVGIRMRKDDAVPHTRGRDWLGRGRGNGSAEQTARPHLSDSRLP